MNNIKIYNVGIQNRPDLVDAGDVTCGRATLAGSDVEFNLHALLKGTVTLTVESGEVDKQIVACVAGDETISLCRVEPLDCANLTLTGLGAVGEGTHGHGGNLRCADRGS